MKTVVLIALLVASTNSLSASSFEKELVLSAEVSAYGCSPYPLCKRKVVSEKTVPAQDWEDLIFGCSPYPLCKRL